MNNYNLNNNNNNNDNVAAIVAVETEYLHDKMGKIENRVKNLEEKDKINNDLRQTLERRKDDMDLLDASISGIQAKIQEQEERLNKIKK